MQPLKRMTKFTPIILILLGFLAFTPKSHALTCSEVRQLTLLYFKMHFSHSEFTEELSKRTLDNFVKAWDPGKLYFLKADVDEFQAKYATKLNDMIHGNMDCSAIDEVMNRYTRRFEERHKYIVKLIDSKHDFTVDEYLNVDRKQVDYPTTIEEVNERWRQRVKFQKMTLLTGVDNGDEKKARERLHKRYQLAVKRQNELTKDRVMGVFMNAFSTALDPHSSYMPADELEDFRIRTRLSLEGIGASLRSEDGFTIVASLVKGGAAEKGGLLKINDKIIAVAQGEGEPVDVIDVDLQEVVKKIRGARGTIVKLTVLREESNKSKKVVIPIARERIQLTEQQASSEVIEVELPDAKGKKNKVKIGVVSLPSFYIDFEGRQKRIQDYRSSSNDTKREIEKLKKQGVDALIMDLRSNGGGSLEESINVAGLFFDKGPVVQVKAQNGEIETYHDRDPKTWYDGPLVVMINRHSASASEILAGAIQDYQRGIIVGDSHTFGKGTVQNLNDLAPKLGAVKVTVNQFYRASGLSTQLEGVQSDIILPSLVDQLEIGEKFYDYALPFEKIKGAPHKMFNQTTPYVADLNKRSQSRLKESESFAEVQKEINDFLKNKEERSKISLKIADAKADKEKDEADEEEKAAEAAMNAQDSDIKDDIFLQEAVKIAADYALLINGKKLAGMPNIPVVDKQEKGAKVTENNKSSNAEKKAVNHP
ncbi:MAG: carboxy terminal-processing peptidase [Oligoflexus sp.]